MMYKYIAIEFISLDLVQYRVAYYCFLFINQCFNKLDRIWVYIEVHLANVE